MIGMYPIIGPSEVIANGEGYIIQKLLPKGWELSDYSKGEDLVEIEDTKVGERFWIKPEAIFRRQISVGGLMWLGKHGANVYTGDGMTTLKVDSFDATIVRKRHYLQAHLILSNIVQEAVKA